MISAHTYICMYISAYRYRYIRMPYKLLCFNRFFLNFYFFLLNHVRATCTTVALIYISIYIYIYMYIYIYLILFYIHKYICIYTYFYTSFNSLS